MSTISGMSRAVLCELLLLAAPVAATGATSAPPPLAGSPPVTLIEHDLDVFPQNFDLVQSPDGLVYVANYEGVLVYDGERWELIELGGDIVRSLAVGPDGRVYVGGFDAFGYIEAGPDGALIYTDISDRFSGLLDEGERYADIWDVLVTDGWIFFQAVQHLFAWDPVEGSVRLWRHDGRFGDIVETDAGVMVQFRGDGFRLLDDDGWRPAPGGGDFPDLVFHLIPLPEGGYLALAGDGRWRVYTPDGARDFEVPAGFPGSNRFTGGLVAEDGRLVLSGDEGGLTVLDRVQERAQRIRLASGYLSGLRRSTQGGLLVASDESIFHVDWPSEWSILGATDGFTGTVHGLAVMEGEHMVLTGSGVQALAATGDGLRFRRTGWTDHEAWDLLPLGDGKALLAASYAVLEVEGDEARPVTHEALYPRVLLASSIDPDRVFVGTELGFAVLERDGTDWELILDRDDLDSLRVNSIVETGPGELVMGSERGGVIRVRLRGDGTGLRSVERFGAERGLDYGEFPSAYVSSMPDGEVLVSTSAGQYLMRGDAFRPTDLGGLDAVRDAGEDLSVQAGPDGSLWAHSYDHVYRKPPGADWRREDISQLLRGALSGMSFVRDATMFGASGAILIHRPLEQGPSALQTAPRVQLRAVTLFPEEGEARRLDLAGPPMEFDYGDFGIRFQFALPDVRRPEATRYRARLAGYEDWPSGWNSTTITYSRLRPGDYSFQVMAVDGRGRTSYSEPFRFKVLPSWYATPWARAAWVLLAVMLISGFTVIMVKARTRRLEGETQRLESMVLERTAELEAVNRQLETMAHVDGLTGIPNRRRLDEYLERVWEQAGERVRPVSVLAIDVDHFKHFNDRHGHLAGDELLKKLARILSGSLRRTEDLAARYGGEEFLVVLPGADAGVAADMAERLRERVEESSLGATISVGLATAVPDGQRPLVSLVDEADSALYAAKAAGRNRVRAAG